MSQERFKEFGKIFEMVTGIPMEKAMRLHAAGNTMAVTLMMHNANQQAARESDPFYQAIKEMADDGNDLAKEALRDPEGVAEKIRKGQIR